MTFAQKKAKLEQVPHLEVKLDNAGWICKHKDCMVLKKVNGGNQMVAYFMYFPTQEEAIENYFYFVTTANTSIMLMPMTTGQAHIEEYVYDGENFSKVVQ